MSDHSSMTFEQRVDALGLCLNDTEDDIIDCIRRHRGDIAALTIQKMSQELYVAPNSIMRLAKKLGYSGFAELKFSIQNERAATDAPFSRQLLEMLPNNIVKTLDIIDMDQVRAVASLLRRSHGCILAGVGDSSYYCELLGKNLRCVDMPAQYFQHIHDMIYAVQHGDANDAVLIISARGENQRLVDLARRVREKGMTVVSITHMKENPLAAQAQYNLYFWGEHRLVQDYNVTDRIGLMLLIRLLSEVFWQSCGFAP